MHVTSKPFDLVHRPPRPRIIHPLEHVQLGIHLEDRGYFLRLHHACEGVVRGALAIRMVAYAGPPQEEDRLHAVELLSDWLTHCHRDHEISDNVSEMGTNYQRCRQPWRGLRPHELLDPDRCIELQAQSRSQASPSVLRYLQLVTGPMWKGGVGPPLLWWRSLRM